MPGSTRTQTRITQDDGRDNRLLVTHVAAALGATRVLLLLVDAGGERRVAAEVLPSGEDAPGLLAAIAPWLDDADRTRRARLRHGPAGAPRAAQRSCIVAPLVAGREVLGHLYADVDGASGRFTQRELETARALAAQAALAHHHRRESELRDAELAVIDSIQQGLASELELQGVIDLVGARLIDVFAADALRIDLLDASRESITYPFVFDHGERFSPPPAPRAGSISGHAMQTRQVLSFGTLDELDAFCVRQGIPRIDLGGDVADQSFVYAPLLIDHEPIGLLVIGK